MIIEVSEKPDLKHIRLQIATRKFSIRTHRFLRTIELDLGTLFSGQACEHEV